MVEELVSLKSRLKELLHENADELHRTRELLLARERKMEDRFAKLDSLLTMREQLGRKLRKTIASTTPDSAHRRARASAAHRRQEDELAGPDVGRPAHLRHRNALVSSLRAPAVAR